MRHLIMEGRSDLMRTLSRELISALRLSFEAWPDVPALRAEALAAVQECHRSSEPRVRGVVQDHCPAWVVAPGPTSMPGVPTDLASWLRVALAVPSFLRKGLVRCTFNAARSRLVRKAILAGGVATILPIIEYGTPSPTKSRDI